MKPPLGSDEEEELGALQKSLRERTNRSIQHLSSLFSSHNSQSGSTQQEALSSSPHTPSTTRQHSQAVHQLRSLLQMHPKDVPLQTNKSPSPTHKKLLAKKRFTDDDSSCLSEVHDLVPIVNQSEYIQHLEAEVKFCKEEIHGLKQRVRVLVFENEKLTKMVEEAKMAEETLKDYTFANSTINVELSPDKTLLKHASIDEAVDLKWKKEMEQLKCLYQAQSETLEAQVASLKKDLSSVQKDYEETKEHLRHKEAMVEAAGSGQRVGGLCLKCAQHVAVLAETHSNIHVQAIERLTKERDELTIMVCSLRDSQSEALQREWAASQQVKQAIVMAEEANLEKTRALVQCEHFHKELDRQRERLETELASEQEKISEARESARAEIKKEKEELNQMMTKLSERVTELESLLERKGREQNSLNGQLEEAFKKLTAQETESSKVCAELRFLLSQAQLKKEEAERALRDNNLKLSRQLQLADQEVQKLGVELSSCRQHLEEAQRAEGRARAEAAGLAEGLSRAQSQLHLTRQEKAALRCSEDMATLTFQAQQRERELTQALQEREAHHESRVREKNDLLSSQDTFIGKMHMEYRKLYEKFQRVIHNGRAEISQLSLEKELLQETTEKLRSRCEKLEECCVQHERTYQYMKDSVEQAEEQRQMSSQQVLQLLGRHTQLMQERRQRTHGMQKLQIQVSPKRPQGHLHEK